MAERSPIYLEKAVESLEGAEGEFGNRRYNSCANRSYYASFQAAIHALERAGIHATTWGHDYVQAQFAGQLITRRKLYSASLRDTLDRTYKVRVIADYARDQVSRTQADRTLRRASEFVTAIVQGDEQS